MKKTWRKWFSAGLLASVLVGAGMVAAQEPGTMPEQKTPPASSAETPATPVQTPAQAAPYQAKFPGDPARSESEAKALGYMRVVLRAQREYKKRHNKYAATLMDLAGTGSLTKRMARTTERDDYSVGFKTEKEGFILTMTPKQMDSEHRSFYADEDGVIHGDDQKPADATSPKVK